MLNIMRKTITTLPSEICDIIYQYYKPQYLIDIENPFNKYCLCSSTRVEYIVRYNARPKRVHKPTKRFNFDIYHLQFDNTRRSILPQQRLYVSSQVDGYYYICKYAWYDLKYKGYREELIELCNIYCIEIKPREHTKKIINKLLKLS